MRAQKISQEVSEEEANEFLESSKKERIRPEIDVTEGYHTNEASGFYCIHFAKLNKAM